MALLLLAGTAAAADPVARFDGIVREVGPLCAMAASARCYATAFERADRDGDGRLDLAELAAVVEDLRAWQAAYGPELSTAERSGVLLGLFVVDTIGLESLFASYDADGDGLLTPDELRVDIALDDRPLGVVVRDPEAVDWVSVRSRLGAMAMLVLPQLGR
jgi:hypothetical protein